MPEDPEPGSSTETHTGPSSVVLRHHPNLTVLTRLRCGFRSTLRHGFESFLNDVARIFLFPHDIVLLLDRAGVGQQMQADTLRSLPRR
jgi:hypothetical protein